MENISPERKKTTLTKKSLLFVLVLLAFVGVSTIATEWMIQQGTDNRIGIVDITGVIQSSQNIIKQIKSFRNDKHIRGIILRIDSPGGAVGPSQEIYDEVLKTRKSGKIIYASMGTLAASGGYYIASAADQIFANPGTLTGSIGVIMAFSNAQGLLEKIGLKPEIIKAGKYKDIGSPTRSMNQIEKSLLQDVVTDVHQQFIEAIANGRGMSIAEITKIADGRIFTGRQAYSLKLVDQLGGLQATIGQLAAKAGIIGAPNVIREKPNTGLLDWVLKTEISPSIVGYLSSPSLQYTWHLDSL
jgi:protease-4|tara:strand:+ start:4034 stop:4933 length:900 start_codon:yes stop_codon:yes gene_type:complete